MKSFYEKDLQELAKSLFGGKSSIELTINDEKYSIILKTYRNWSWTGSSHNFLNICIVHTDEKKKDQYPSWTSGKMGINSVKKYFEKEVPEGISIIKNEIIREKESYIKIINNLHKSSELKMAIFETFSPDNIDMNKNKLIINNYEKVKGYFDDISSKYSSDGKYKTMPVMRRNLNAELKKNNLTFIINSEHNMTTNAHINMENIKIDTVEKAEEIRNIIIRLNKLQSK